MLIDRFDAIRLAVLAAVLGMLGAALVDYSFDYTSDGFRRLGLDNGRQISLGRSSGRSLKDAYGRPEGL